MSEPTKPTISVVMPVYNGAKFLREALESVLAQTYRPLEVLVIDDGSTDESGQIAESYGPPVRVIRQRNQGESTARNRGLDEARGDWVAFIDADDLWTPDKLARQVAAVGDAKDVVCVHTGVMMFGAFDGPMQYPPESQRYRVSQVVGMGSPIQLSSAMVRRDLPTRFPAWSKYGEDLVYFLDLLQLGRQVLVDDYLTRYRKHPTSLSMQPEFELQWVASGGRWVEDHASSLPPAELRAARAIVRRKSADARLSLARRLRDAGRYRASLAEFFHAMCAGRPLAAALGMGRLLLVMARQLFRGERFTSRVA